MAAQSKSRQSTDAQGNSSELWRLEAEMLSAVPRKELGGAALAAGGARGSVTAAAKATAKLFSFFACFRKSPNPLWISFR